MPAGNGYDSIYTQYTLACGLQESANEMDVDRCC